MENMIDLTTRYTVAEIALFYINKTFSKVFDKDYNLTYETMMKTCNEANIELVEKFK